MNPIKLCIAFTLGLAAGTAAADVAEDPSGAVRFAALAGAMAGDADYCKADWDGIVRMVQRTLWHTKRLSQSGREAMRASGVFREVARRHAGSGPADGCEAFLPRFAAFREELERDDVAAPAVTSAH